MKFGTILVALCAWSALAPRAHAAEANKPLAVVNGVAISSEVLDVLVANQVAQGTKDTPELRAAVKAELVAREVLAQEAKRLKLDQQPPVKTQLMLQQNAMLADALIAKQSEKFNITDEKLRAEYKRQLDLLNDADEYQLSHVVTATQADAMAVIKAAEDGTAFDTLARERSTSPSRQHGGSLGWLVTNQINPEVVKAISALSVGAVAPQPVSTPEGWQVLRLDGKRKFKAPSFEDSKQQLVNAVFANERAEYVQRLLKAAKIAN